MKDRFSKRIGLQLAIIMLKLNPANFLRCIIPYCYFYSYRPTMIGQYRAIT